MSVHFTTSGPREQLAQFEAYVEHGSAALVETFLLLFKDDFETAVVNGTVEPPDYAG